MISAGTYRARAIGPCVLGTSKNNGTPFIELYFQIVGGDNAGGKVRWTSYFSEKSSERTIQALKIMGWSGEDLSDFSDCCLHDLDTNEVDIVVELETYKNKDGEERTSARVKWVNRACGYLNTDGAMNAEAAQSFGNRMRGLVLAVKAKQPAPKGDGTDFNFGANVAQPVATPAAPAVPGVPPKRAF
jgi:hypothetical protein